jgi:hypothetical protein
MALPQRKLAISLTTWMCVPEFGMTGMEVLCRGSAFLTPVRTWNGDKGIVRLFFVVMVLSLT